MMDFMLLKKNTFVHILKSIFQINKYNLLSIALESETILWLQW